MAPEKANPTFVLRTHGEECFSNTELLKALRDAERQVRLFRADIVGLHKKFKLIERRLQKLEAKE